MISNCLDKHVDTGTIFYQNLFDRYSLNPVIKLTHGGVLYIGSATAATNETILRKHNITHIVSVKYKNEAEYEQFQGITYLPIENLADNLFDTDVPTFQALHPVVTAFIRSVQKGNVLIHCVCGVSRSAAFAMAYLMSELGITNADEALLTVQKCRKCVSPSEEFVEVLRKDFKK